VKVCLSTQFLVARLNESCVLCRNTGQSRSDCTTDTPQAPTRLVTIFFFFFMETIASHVFKLKFFVDFLFQSDTFNSILFA
jgi:hypothetical protein